MCHLPSGWIEQKAGKLVVAVARADATSKHTVKRRMGQAGKTGPSPWIVTKSGRCVPCFGCYSDPAKAARDIDRMEHRA